MEKNIFEDLAGKFGKITVPEGSLIKKLEKIKKSQAPSFDAKGGATLHPDVIEQLREELRKTPEEMNKKIEEIVSSKTEQIKTTAEAVKNLESQISKIEQIVSSGKKGKDEFKERLDKMDETILELLSLYEVVSSTVNPFVGDKENPMAEKLGQIERRVEELSQKAPEVPPNLTADFENKFKALENNMGELKKIVESGTVNQDALLDKVAGQVLERIKPEVERLKPMVSRIPAQAAVRTITQPAEEAYQYSDEPGVKLSYLDNRPETSIILLNWLEFLMEKAGRNNLIDILEYYIEIGWISDDVSSKMIDMANGIDYYVERPTWKLLPEDHTKSLLFIEQLRGKKVDKNLLSRLERDIDKIIRSSEVLVT
ncbi:MAG: FlaD/FlaE family flagellar protein [Candidatus Methanoperedens sp.]|nr:FlaD/FlaE family flagellar protein [Candidatus Methanoperedens sp.]